MGGADRKPASDVIDEEFAHHLDQLRIMLQAEGLSPEAAAAEAQRRFGSLERYRAACSTAGRPPGNIHRAENRIHSLIQHVGYALRTLRRAPGFAVTVIFTLALGIGANAAIFSVVHGVLLRPLGFANPDALVALWDSNNDLGVEDSPTSPPTYIDWRDQSTSFTSLAAWTWTSLTLEDADASAEYQGVLVTGNYFTTLGVMPFLGRLFTADDVVPRARGNVVILSHAVWRDRFGSDPAVVGRTLTVDTQPVTVVGVMRPAVAAPDPDVAMWIPADFTPANVNNRGVRTLFVVGRLAPGATIAVARQEIHGISQRIATLHPTSARGWSATVVSMREQIVGDVRTSLMIAFASVAMLLLIACVNIANLFLARTAAREREMAVRAALGAGRGRLARQLLTESTVLSLVGGMGGLVVALVAHHTLLALEPGVIPRLDEVGLGAPVFLFAGALSFATGIFFGLTPALTASGFDVMLRLKAGDRGGGPSRSPNRMRTALIVTQVALTLMLLTGAGLLARTVIALRSVDPGFDPTGVVAARIFLDGRKYGADGATTQYYTELLARVGQIPGVANAGASSSLPMDPVGTNFDLPFRTERTAGEQSGDLPQADFRVVTSGYFEAMRIRVLRGRTFAVTDDATAPAVVMINRAMADQFWPGGDPVGGRLETVFGGWNWYEVIGVVENTRYYGLDSEPRAEMYVAAPQVPFGSMTVVARGSAPPAALATQLNAAILEIDPTQPPSSVLPVAELVADDIAAERFSAALLGSFALVATALAAAGVFGALSYWVSHRTREIGVRMALGARPKDVTFLVVGTGMLAAGGGIGLGLAGASVANRMLQGMLFGVTAMDPLTFVAGATLLGGTALLSCWLPAHRASSVDPMRALRDD